MAEHEGEALRREFSKIARGRGQRYPVVLKERTVAWVRRARTSGATWTEVANGIGLHPETIRCWCRDAGRRTMRRVVIADDHAASTVSVVSPSGLRVEGLLLRDAIAILEKLG